MPTPRRTIKVPLELTKAIDKFIAKSKGFYRSRPEVTSAALEKFLQLKKRGRKRRKKK